MLIEAERATTRDSIPICYGSRLSSEASSPHSRFNVPQRRFLTPRARPLAPIVAVRSWPGEQLPLHLRRIAPLQGCMQVYNAGRRDKDKILKGRCPTTLPEQPQPQEWELHRLWAVGMGLCISFNRLPLTSRSRLSSTTTPTIKAH